MEQLKTLKEQLISVVQGQMGNLANTDAKELGEVVDMIKDLADAMKLCEEEKYYKTVTEAMEKQDKEPKERHYYTPMYIEPHTPPMYYTDERDMDRHMGRMYYRGQPRNSRGEFTSRSGRSMYGGDQRYEDIEYYGGQEGGRYMYGGQNGNSNSGNSGSSGGNTGSSGSTRQYHEHEFPIEMRDTREGRSGMSRRMYMESKEMHKDKAVKIKDLEKYMGELGEDIVEMIKDSSPEEKQILEKKISALATKISQLGNG